MRSALTVAKRTLIAFYNDQMTHHAAALTYYSLLSLFPAVLLGLSLLAVLGQYPGTYEEIISYLREVAPDSTLETLDAALKTALENKSGAVTGLVISVIVTFYGTTGVLEAARRALNIVFEVEGGRSFLQRKSIDIVSSIILGALVLITLILLFVGGGFAEDIFGFIGIGSTIETIWSYARWPAAFIVAMMIFSFIYYVTPDVRPRAFHWLTPGALAAVIVWLIASAGFSLYISNFTDVNATYGSFGAAIVLIFWLWLTNVAMLFGAELNAEIEREKELDEGKTMEETLALEERGSNSSEA